MSHLTTWAKVALRILLGATLLLGVVLADGRPVVFADTNIYYWMGEMQLRPIRYALAPLIGGPANVAQDPDAADELPAEMQLRRTEMAARSPWFGMLLYAATGWGNLWWLAGLQALALSFAVHTLWRSLLPRGRNQDWIALMGCLAVASTLPFFAGFAMPDVWAGAGLIAVSSLLFLRDRISLPGQVGLFTLLVASFAFHQSNGMVALLAAGIISLIGTLALKIPFKKLMPGLSALLTGILISLLLNAGYVGEVRKATGETMRSPPFLVARVLADGPGRRYLRSSCASGTDWALCRFRKLPLSDSQDILWSGDPAKGVFGRATTAERIRIDDQQLRFVALAVLSDPIGETAAALANFTTALTNVHLDDPLRDPHYYLTDPDWSDTYIADMVHKLGPCGPNESTCKPRWAEGESRTWHGASFVISLIILACMALPLRQKYQLARKDRDNLNMWMITATMILALIINAAVTGVLSGPFPRYQARISWLVPLMAGLFILHGRQGRKGIGRGDPSG